MSWTLCTSGAASRKAGVNADDVRTSGAAMANWSDEAESYVCGLVRSDVVTKYGSLTANGKQMLDFLTAAKIAQEIIVHDASGFTSRYEAELMLDKLENDIKKIEALLKDNKHKVYLGIT